MANEKPTDNNESSADSAENIRDKTSLPPEKEALLARIRQLRDEIGPVPFSGKELISQAREDD